MDNTILVDSIRLCVRARDSNHDCKYAICNECYDAKSGKRRRGPGSGSDDKSECRKQCVAGRHEMRNLEMEFDVWWCKENAINGPAWKMKPQGCVLCERMFVCT